MTFSSFQAFQIELKGFFLCKESLFTFLLYKRRNRYAKMIVEVMSMAWWWSILLFIAGACVGAVVMGVCAYDSVHNGKKWWDEDDQ